MDTPLVEIPIHLITFELSIGSGMTGQKVKIFVGVHGFKGSGVQARILVPGLHLGCIFTGKASASSGLIQNLEPNW